MRKKGWARWHASMSGFRQRVGGRRTSVGIKSTICKFRRGDNSTYTHSCMEFLRRPATPSVTSMRCKLLKAPTALTRPHYDVSLLWPIAYHWHLWGVSVGLAFCCEWRWSRVDTHASAQSVPMPWPAWEMDVVYTDRPLLGLCIYD